MPISHKVVCTGPLAERAVMTITARYYDLKCLVSRKLFLSVLSNCTS